MWRCCSGWRSVLADAKPSLVLAGGTGVHALDLALAVNAINQAVGNVGQTVKPAEAITAFEHAATTRMCAIWRTGCGRGRCPSSWYAA